MKTKRDKAIFKRKPAYRMNVHSFFVKQSDIEAANSPKTLFRVWVRPGKSAFWRRVRFSEFN